MANTTTGTPQQASPATTGTSATTNLPLPPPPNPRIGGGNGKQETPWWTGGSNVITSRLARPKSVMAYRPQGDLRSQDRIYRYCTEGLEEERHLGPVEDSNTTVSITTWVAQIRHAMEERGMDTVMRIYNASTQQELYMLSSEHWGRIAASDVTEQVVEYTTGVYQHGSTTQRNPSCAFDRDNLRWSGQFIMNSITLPLWQLIERETGPEPTGPEAFYAIIQHAQVATASMVQSLVNDLKKMSLKQEPGQHVEQFSIKVTNIGRRLSGSFIPVPNLNSLIIKPYLDCEVEAFRMTAIQLHAEADKQNSSSTVAIKSQSNAQAAPEFQTYITQLNSRFRELKAQDLWTPLAGPKVDSPEVQALRGQIKALSQKVNTQGGGGRGGRFNCGKRDKSQDTCHNCGEKGHHSYECPENGNSNDNNNDGQSSSNGMSESSQEEDNWKKKPPPEGDSEVKIVDGVTWKWCNKCWRKTWRRGPGAHTTSEHKSKAELQEENKQENTAIGGHYLVGGGRLTMTTPPGLYMLCSETQLKCPKQPKRNQGNGNSSNSKSGRVNWKKQPPAQGASEVKTVDGITWKWCEKCWRKTWRRGPGAHTTSEHKSKSEIQEQNPQGNVSVDRGSSTTKGCLQLCAPAGSHPLMFEEKKAVSLVIDAPIDDTEHMRETSQINVPVIETTLDNDEDDCLPPCKEETIDLFPNHPDHLADKIAQVKLNQVEEIPKLHAETLHCLQCNYTKIDKEDDECNDTWEDLAFYDSFTFDEQEDNDDVLQDCLPKVIAGRTH